jgi:hypothetical protein
MSSSVITINAVPSSSVPTASARYSLLVYAIRNDCIFDSNRVEYSLNGTTYQSSNTFSGLAPNDYTLYVRNSADATCVTISSSPITINTVPLPPAVPTASATVQPTCATPSEQSQ